MRFTMHATVSDLNNFATHSSDTGEMNPQALGEFEDWLAKKGVALGLTVSFSGILTYKTAQNLRDTARDLPEDRMGRSLPHGRGRT